MTTIKDILATILLLIPAAGFGQQVDRLGLTDIEVERLDSVTLLVGMTVKPSLCHLGSDHLIKVAPVLRSNDGENRKELPAYSIAGKNQYYYTIRSNKSETPVYRSGSGVTERFTYEVPWQNWMGTSNIGFTVLTSTCCGKPVGEEDLTVVDIDLVPPVIPVSSDLESVPAVKKGVKEFIIEGRAYVNFPVNRTEIYPKYMNNPAELKKITNSIDTVKGNPDAKIESITLTGYASPEGPYQNNVRLAKGRTQAVKEYVSNLYDFPNDIYATYWVPEDWAGLRESIAESDLPNRERMISFIDSDYPVPTRNDEFRKLFPGNYEWLLKNVYPWLRHTDYLIKYTVRHYTTVEEVKSVLKTRPQNLSIDELYMLARAYPAGSEEYNEVFEVAVRLFPENEIANLNAANTAIAKGELGTAEKYLRKAGISPDAEYARAMYYAKKKDYDTAMEILKNINSEKAKEALERVKKVKNFKGNIRFRNL